jgi:hypothetical protein
MPYSSDMSSQPSTRPSLRRERPIFNFDEVNQIVINTHLLSYSEFDNFTFGILKMKESTFDVMPGMPVLNLNSNVKR